MGYLKERIKHAVRFRHKRGYGVHSPFMFNLILNVIRDREKQFQYPERLERENCLNHRERKIFRLLSRLVRSLRVHRMIFRLLSRLVRSLRVYRHFLPGK